jgi:hypothetical protein
MNLFSRLEKYRNDQEENFFTEAFAGALEAEQKSFLRFLLRKLDPYLELDGDPEKIEIRTQTRYSSEDPKEISNQPDMEIEDSTTLIFIENKLEAKERPGQLEDYAKLLAKQGKKSKRLLIYITRHDVESSYLGDQQIKYFPRRWFDVCDHLKAYIERENPKSDIIKEFLNFMEAKDMELRRVETDLWSGARSLQSFINQIEYAVKNRGPDFDLTYVGEDMSAGWYGVKTKCLKNMVWIGIYPANPQELIVDFVDLGAQREKAGSVGLIPVFPHGGRHYGFSVNLVQEHFFERDKAGQLRYWEEIIERTAGYIKKLN